MIVKKRESLTASPTNKWLDFLLFFLSSSLFLKNKNIFRIVRGQNWTIDLTSHDQRERQKRETSLEYKATVKQPGPKSRPLKHKKKEKNSQLLVAVRSRRTKSSPSLYTLRRHIQQGLIWLVRDPTLCNCIKREPEYDDTRSFFLASPFFFKFHFLFERSFSRLLNIEET